MTKTNFNKKLPQIVKKQPNETTLNALVLVSIVVIGLVIFMFLGFITGGYTTTSKNEKICIEMGLTNESCYCTNGTCHKKPDQLQTIFTDMRDVIEQREEPINYPIKLVICDKDETYIGIWNRTAIDKYINLTAQHPEYINLSQRGRLFLYHPIVCSYRGKVFGEQCHSERNIWIIGNETCHVFYFTSEFLLINLNRIYNNEVI